MRTNPGGYSASPPTPDDSATAGAEIRGAEGDAAGQLLAVSAVPGVEPGPESSATTPEQAESALAASSRAEASLNSLYSAIQQVSAGVAGARQANEQLTSELSRVREALAASSEQRLALEDRIGVLEAELEATREQSERERRFLIDEQDRFLAAVLEEHEAALGKLTSEHDAAPSRPEPSVRDAQTEPPFGRRAPNSAAGPETQPAGPPSSARSTRPGLAPPLSDVEDANRVILKLMAERDRARDVLRRLQTQRDEAQQTVADLTAERDRLLADLQHLAPAKYAAKAKWPPQHDGRRTQPAVPHKVPRVTDPCPPEPDAQGENISERVTTPPPPEELHAAISASRPSPPAGIAAVRPEDPTPRLPETLGIDQRPVLKRKPDPAAAPLGGYSVSGESLDEEWIDRSSGTPARQRG